MTADSEFRLGQWTVQPDLNALRQGDTEVRVEPRYMDLLVYLARHAGEVVSADAILEQVWSGQVVGDHSVYQGIARLRKALGDSTQHPRYIETVAKRGYRLIADLERQAPTTGDQTTDRQRSALTPDGSKIPVAEKATDARPLIFNTRRRILAVGLVLVAIGVAILWLSGSDGSRPAYKTVAVLPFENLSPSEDDVYFADGLASELISALGHLEGLKVLGQTSSFSFRNKHESSASVGRILKADALVEGSVRRSGGRLRIFIEVIDSKTGYQIWSKTYERKLIDVFDIQEDIARSVVESLRGRIYGVELPRLTPAPPDSIEAYDYYLLGQYYRSTRSVSGLERALKMYRMATSADASYAPGYRGIGASELLLSYYGAVTLGHALKLAGPALDKAMELDPLDAETAGSMGLERYMQGEYALAEHYLDQALDFNPNYAEGWMWRGLALEKQGRLKRAQADYAQALLLEPLSVPVAVNYAMSLSRLGMRDEALAALNALATPDIKSPQLYRRLAYLALEAGDLKKAYDWSNTASGLHGEEASSRAMKALTLAYLDQTAQALELSDRVLSDGFSGQHTRELLELLYLSTGDALRLEGLTEIERASFDKEDVPAIEWRRMNAHSGIAALRLGRIADAVSSLEEAFKGSTDAIVGTDFDLIYCTSLALAYSKIGDSKRSGHWTKHCGKSFADAREQGWNSNWMGYASARLAMLNGEPETGLAELGRLASHGFRGFGFIANDPAFESLATDQRFQDMLASLRADAEATWAKIAP